MSLFGTSTPSNQAKPSLFGNPNTPQPSASPFGSAQPQQSNSLFGQSSNQPQQSSGSSLFGQPQNQNQNQQQTGSSLFGQPQQQQQQNTSGSGLFGQPQQQQQSNSGSSLFGQPQQQQNNNNSNSLFGQPQQQSTGNSLFSQPQQQQQPSNNTFGQSSLFASTNQNQQNNQLGSSQAQGTLRAGSQPLWQGSQSLVPREKGVVDQMTTLMKKWSPETAECCFQRYFYNNVGADRVPYFGPGPDEDESKWEEALSKKPDSDSIPVLCKGFAALGERLRVQVQAVQGLQARLHEINNSLAAQQQGHDLDISARAADARRKHVALSQRCLQLATKVQVLRNRGYVMDSAEEEVKSKLAHLERSAFDPALSGRQEEIWARMVGIHERAKILQAEAERINTGLKEQNEAGIDEEILRRTKKVRSTAVGISSSSVLLTVRQILNDYDSQISHLQREVTEIRKDFEDWEGNGFGRRQ